MAIIYRTTMSPSKLELLAEWLPAQSWFAGDAAALDTVGAYRFDDPAGEVGLEGMLLTAGDETVYHVPLSYRDAPLERGEAFLLGTSEHGVLGTRWITDGAGDPVFRAALAEAMATGGHGADMTVHETDGSRTTRATTVDVQGSGHPGTEVPDLREASAETVGTLTRIEDQYVTLDIVRVVDPSIQAKEDQLSLRASSQDQKLSAILALLYGG